jgi:hypothetical protein
MGNDLSQLPNVNRASLPQTYVNAKTALAECSKIDECKDWADKAEAMASYARQAKDKTLQNMAIRIQARAIRRCGELLKKIIPAKNQYDAKNRATASAGGGTNNTQTSSARDGTVPCSRKQAAEAAGLSERQRKTALRVAEVPKEEFEQKVESDDPPTVSVFAEIGTKRSEKDFQRATEALGTLRQFSKYCAENSPENVAAGVLPHEVANARKWVSEVDAWLDRFITTLEG